MAPCHGWPQSSEGDRVKTFSHTYRGAQRSSADVFPVTYCSWPSLSEGTPGTIVSTVVSAFFI